MKVLTPQKSGGSFESAAHLFPGNRLSCFVVARVKMRNIFSLSLLGAVAESAFHSVVWVGVGLFGERGGLFVFSNTGTITMFVGLLVADQKFTILVVSARCVPGDFDHIEDRSSPAENRVHLFKGAVGGLGVEEVDDRDDECIAA